MFENVVNKNTISDSVIVLKLSSKLEISKGKAEKVNDILA
jgi:hypothetical protein